MMNQIRQENLALEQSISAILEEIDKQRQLNTQHESEIETLLKFNERLLAIIETQLSNKRETNSLHPISERSERESDVLCSNIGSMMQSIRLARKDRIDDQTSNSLIDKRANSFGKKGGLGRLFLDGGKSQIQRSFDKDEISDYGRQERSERQGSKQLLGFKVPTPPSPPQSVQNTHHDEVQKQMSSQIANLQQFKAQSNQFYQQKIGQIRNLSSKLSNYKPEQQFNQISKKLNLSSATSQRIEAIMKKK